MYSRTALAFAMFACLGCARSPVDDVARVLATCRIARGNDSASVQCMMQRPEGTWQLVRVDYSAIHDMSDSCLESVRALANLDSLSLTSHRPDGDYSQLTPRGIRSLGRLRLRRLFLPRSLTEEGIEAISTLRQLEDLDLGYARDRPMGDAGLIYLANLRNLRRLDLEGVGLTDASMKYIKPLKGLEELNLQRNPRITDAGLAELEGLVNLRELRLGDSSKITDAGVVQLRSLRKLSFLQLYRIGPTGLAALKDLPHLEHLEIGSYDPGPGEPDLSVLRGLKWLEIMHVSGQDSRRVILPPTLQRLDVPYSMAARLDFESAKRIDHVLVYLGRSLRDYKQPRDLKWLSSVPELRELTLFGSFESDVKAVAGLTSLRRLNLTGNACLPTIGDGGMRSLAGLSNLESLTIEDYYGGGIKELEVNSGMDVLPRLRKLRRLELRGLPALTTPALANIWELKELRVLELHISGERLDEPLHDGLAGINALSELEELSLPLTVRLRLTDDGLKNLASLKKLRRLDLGSIEGYTDDALASLMRALPDLQVLKRTYKSR